MTGISTLRIRIADAIAAGYERGVDDTCRRARLAVYEAVDRIAAEHDDIGEKCRAMMTCLRLADLVVTALRERPDPAADYAHRKWVDRQLERGGW